jgi:hypothetical protein
VRVVKYGNRIRREILFQRTVAQRFPKVTSSWVQLLERYRANRNPIDLRVLALRFVKSHRAGEFDLPFRRTPAMQPWMAQTGSISFKRLRKLILSRDLPGRRKTCLNWWCVGLSATLRVICDKQNARKSQSEIEVSGHNYAIGCLHPAEYLPVT